MGERARGPLQMVDEDTRVRHVEETRRAFVSADRLALYAQLAALAGAIVVLAVAGAVVVGWLGWSEGVPLLAGAILVAIVPAANFYSDSHRTALHASRMERLLEVDEDLYDEALARRQRIRTVLVVAFVVAAAAGAAIVGYSLANAGTEKPDDDDRTEVDDDDDDDGPDDDGGDDGPGDDGGDDGPDDDGSGGDDD